MRGVTKPPEVVGQLAELVDLPKLRAYPMLTAAGSWSIRLDGLEVGRIRGDAGWLDVGRDREDRRGPARSSWLQSAGQVDRIEFAVGEALPIAQAAAAIRRFAAVWPDRAKPDVENEHALESRVLSGEVAITTTAGQLELIRPDDGFVNWGSQFPTKWGRAGKARYLDAFLRDGAVPWAIELKVAGGGGTGRYYRHAIAQAVLYKHFIRNAEPLHWWFKAQDGLDATKCEAAVVVPTMAPPRDPKPLRLLAHQFQVEFLEVKPEFAKAQRPTSIPAASE